MRPPQGGRAATHNSTREGSHAATHNSANCFKLSSFLFCYSAHYSAHNLKKRLGRIQYAAQHLKGCSKKQSVCHPFFGSQEQKFLTQPLDHFQGQFASNPNKISHILNLKAISLKVKIWDTAWGSFNSIASSTREESLLELFQRILLSVWRDQRGCTVPERE